MVTHVRTLIANLADVDSIVAAPESVLRAIGRETGGDHALPDGRAPQGYFWRWGKEAGDWARVAKADVLHGHGIRWAMLFQVAARRANVPLVITIHNLLPAMHVVASQTLRFFLSRTDHLIAVSEAVGENLRALLGTDARVTVIPNGVDAAAFVDGRWPDRALVRRELGLPEDVPVAVCVARLSAEKNVAGFVEASALVDAGGGAAAHARFVIVGDGPEREALARQIEAAGLRDRVMLLGARSDVPALMRAADVVCVPSKVEGFGLVAVEAMAAGRPVVATRVGGLTEVVLDGETGMLVDLCGGAEAMASAMRVLLEDRDKAADLGRAGRARAERLYRAEAMTSATRAIYEQLAGRR